MNLAAVAIVLAIILWLLFEQPPPNWPLLVML
jgi:hypothetical protein